jgi:hypothetical protein
MLTSDPIYKMPLVPWIRIFDLTQTSTLYTFDPFTDVGTSAKPIYCNVSLSSDHSGIFVLEIENSGQTLDTSNINKGCRVLIGCGKQASQINYLAWFLVRKSGYSRGKKDNAIYTLSGSTPQIRNNERIIYYVKEAAKLAMDGKTIDVNDVNMKADLLLQNAYNLDSSYPLNKERESTQPSNTAPYISTGSLATISDVENFIASLNIELGSLQDLINLVEEQTTGEMSYQTTLTLFNAALQYPLNPLTTGRGFTIKNTIGTADDADDTCYLKGGSWDYEESCYQSDSYSNRIFGLMAEEPDPTEDAVTTYNTVGDLSANYITQRFRPTTSNPDRIILAMTATGTPTVPIYINVRVNTGGSPNPFTSFTNDFIANPPVPSLGGTVVTTPQLVEFVRSPNLIPNMGLDLTSDYWLTVIKGGTSTNHYNWCSKASSGAQSGTSPAINTAFNTPLGTLYAFWVPRRPKAFEASDYKAISALGIIESTLSNTPATVKTNEMMHKYLVNQLYYMARPRANWNQPTVTAPNVPIFPGDPLMIYDSILGFSTPGNQVTMTTSGPIDYTWGTSGGQGLTYQRPTLLSIQPVSNPTRYK